ncbi:MAG: SPOR domain-containing protein [Ignavibacteria bacterium]|nr:SPOR domain-containing protein [Ignavibacteria bacterium]
MDAPRAPVAKPPDLNPMAETEEQVPPSQAATAPPRDADTQEIEDGTHQAGRPPSRRGPVITFAVIAALLLALSFLWFFEPFPVLKQKLERLVGTRPAPVQPRVAVSSRTAPVNTTAAAGQRAGASPAGATVDSTIPQGDWDYFVQVASSPRNPDAQVIANTLKRRGIAARTEPEFVQRQRRTFYRVKAGPYLTSAQAETMRDSLRRTWRDAFVDSARYEAYLHENPSPLVLQPEQGGALHTRKSPGAAKAVPLTARGFGIRVSAFQQKQTAQSEMRALLARGYPAFLTSKATPSGVWYRVYVGPFPTRPEADTYAGSIRSKINSSAYVVDFSSEQSK